MPLESRLERRRSFDEMCREHEVGGVSVHYLTPAENFIGSWTTRSRRRLMLRFEYICGPALLPQQATIVSS